MDDKTHAVDSFDLTDNAAEQPALNREMLLEIAYFEQDAHWYSVQRTQWPGLTSVSGTSAGP